MKISSVSKKVLASALSAAMVVAFAPTVAFGAQAPLTDPTNPVQTSDTVAVTYDINGGAIDSNSSYTTLAAETAKVYTAGGKSYVKIDKTANVSPYAVNSAIAKKQGVNASEWFVDTDSDGIYDESEYAVNANGWVEVEAGTTALTLKAYYATPSITTADDSVFKVLGTATIGTSVTAKGLTRKTFYTATLVDPAGTVIAASDPTKCTNANAQAFTLAETSAYTAASYKLAKGDYTLKVTENGKTEPVIAKAYTVVELTLAPGVYGTFDSSATTSVLITKDTKIDASLLGNLSKPNSDGGFAPTGWEADGAAVTANSSFKKDTVLTAVYDNPQVSAVTFDATTYTAAGKGTLALEADNLPIPTGEATYHFTVTGPNGFSKVIKNDGTNNPITAVNGTKLGTAKCSATLTFGADYESYAAVANKLEAGTYTVSVALVANEGKTLNDADKKVSVTSKSVSLAAVSYDLGAGAWDTTDAAKNAQKAQKTLAVVGTSISTIKGALTVQLTDTNIKATDTLQTIDYTTIDGVKYSKIDKETVGADGVKVAVVYAASKAALPAVTFASNGTGYIATIAAAAGTTVTYDVNDTTYKALGADNQVKLAATDTLNIKSAAGTKTNTVAYVGCSDATTNPLSAVSQFATGIANGTTSTSAANKPVRYGDTLTTLKADSEAVIKGIGFATANGWKEAVAAEKKAILDKAAALEVANIEAAKALVKGADGKYTYVAGVDAAKAEAAVAQVIADFQGLTNVALGKAKTYTAKSKYDTTNLVTAAGTGSQYAAAMKIAATATKTTVAADVAEPAIAVSGQLAAAKTAAEAQAAIEAYNKLTAAQKALVSAADLAAAEAVVAAAAVKDAQDDAAVSKTRDASKTVKAGKNGKTTKKQSVTLKKITSKSGAKVTYKKSSGSSKISVKSGKAYLAKGVKKGTYKATVKATCGTQTAKIKVTFKVK